MSVFGDILVRIFLLLDWIQFKCRKMQSRTTPIKDNFTQWGFIFIFAKALRIFTGKKLFQIKFKRICIFFSIWVFFYEHSRITGLQVKGEGISLTPHYHFHPLHKYLDISRAITAESSPLHLASSRTWVGKLWFPSASR